MTYEALYREVDRIAALLADAGIGRHCRVGVALPGTPEAAVMLLATLAGAVCVPIDPRLGTTDSRFLLRRVRVEALLSLEGTELPTASIARSLGLSGLRLLPRPTDGTGAFDLHFESVRPAVPRSTPLPDDIAIVFQTSGTTATPKVVPLRQSQLIARAGRQPITQADRCLFVSPIHTSGGLHALLAPLAAGASIGFVQGSGPGAVADALVALEPTYVSVSPALLSSLLDCRELDGRTRPPRLRFVRCSSSALAPSLQARAEAVLGVPVVQGYGMTEAGPIAQNPLPPARRKPGSVGISVGPAIAIVDGEGNPLGADAEGEIAVKDPGVMSEYENDPEATHKAFHDGWFLTGDSGRLDNDGYLFITGRLNERINRGGIKISPSEVDQVLLEHADILDAATFGVPHPTLGQDLVAAVVVRPQCTASVEQLREFASKHLAAHKVPSDILLVATLPRSPHGKIDRDALAVSLADRLSPEYVAPRSPREARLAAIIAEVLQLERVGTTDNFFVLGGDSLRAVQVVWRINSELGVQLGHDALVQRPTIAELVAALPPESEG